MTVINVPERKRFEIGLSVGLAFCDHAVAMLLAGLHALPQLAGEVLGAADVEAVVSLLQSHLHVHAFLDQLAVSVRTPDMS